MGLCIGGHNSPQLAEIKTISAHGNLACGCFILYIHMEASVKLKAEAEISDLNCKIELQNPRIAIAHGILAGHPRLVWTEYTSDAQIGFHFYLSATQISQIEIARGSGDLNLSVWLYGTTHYQNRPQTFASQSGFTILKQQWLAALDQMGYKKTLLFELSLPGNEEDDSILSKLKRSQSHIFNGAYQEAVGLCRQVIEEIEEARGDKKIAVEAVKKYKSADRVNMTVNERMLLLREVLKNITHLGNHPQDDLFSRLQAHSILGTTVALLSSPEIGIRL